MKQMLGSQLSALGSRPSAWHTGKRIGLLRLAFVLTLSGNLIGSAKAQFNGLEFFNYTGIQMKIWFEVWHYSPCPGDASSGTFDACIDANDSYVFPADETKFIKHVYVACNCGETPDADITCDNTEGVSFPCGLLDQFVMGISKHGWRVEPQ